MGKQEIEVIIPQIEPEEIQITLIGTKNLICNRFSERKIQEIQDKQAKKAKGPRAIKDPQRDYLDSLYKVGDGYGMPAKNFKESAVAACSFLGKEVTKILIKGALFVEGEILPVRGKVSMRVDPVRLQGIGRPIDIRYRGQFEAPWEVDLTLRYNKNLLSASQVVNLFNAAGFHIGVGDYRKEYGKFKVKMTDV